jgi:hypothetical protein
MEDLDVTEGSSFRIHELRDEIGIVLHSCATGTFPLREDHWIFNRTEDAPNPIGESAREMLPRLEEILKQTIRDSTACGRDMDFDPDAMLQNFRLLLIGNQSQLNE